MLFVKEHTQVEKICLNWTNLDTDLQHFSIFEEHSYSTDSSVVITDYPNLTFPSFINRRVEAVLLSPNLGVCIRDHKLLSTVSV